MTRRPMPAPMKSNPRITPTPKPCRRVIDRIAMPRTIITTAIVCTSVRYMLIRAAPSSLRLSRGLLACGDHHATRRVFQHVRDSSAEDALVAPTPRAEHDDLGATPVGLLHDRAPRLTRADDTLDGPNTVRF